ncbi:rib72 protein- like protein [Trypanosoma brucei equiperdum]|uniref:Rib72 protein-like protein n=1 Tax=Trypanosoma brucei equiperdum TaxID=630700 RepID=A0A3L6KZ67_9TRYP|nr:rib72 protein- like protein [Trypanosoma brucei equiperdum]
MTDRTIYDALPKLPGFSFPELNPPPTNGIPQLCTIRKGIRTVFDPSGSSKRSEKQGGDGCGGLQPAQIFAKFPDWKSLDDKALRFFGYYVERVDESSIEKMRVRKVKMYLHLSDGSISVYETPAVVNSGLRRGLTVSRTIIDGVGVRSLFVGSVVNIRGLQYHIVDCDGATREFCEAMGIPQAEPLDYPSDTFEQSVLVQRNPKDELHVDLRHNVEVMAATAAGTHVSLLTPEERETARNFFEHDREVLRFAATWEQRAFKLLYYIADKTMSVMVESVRNDGRDPNPVFIRRTKIPKYPVTRVKETETLNVPLTRPVEYITEDDLQTGQTINLMTREFYIYDCDKFTRDYYAAKGVGQPSFPKPKTESDSLMPTVKPSKQPTKPTARKEARGVSTMTFEDTVVEKDRLKLIHYCNDVFRFAARLVSDRYEDEGRKFLFCYYLADDTVGMYEIPVHNSGHLGGKCFARSPVAEIPEPSKLYVGAKVKLAGAEYELIDMDERTKRYIEMGFPHMDESYFSTQELIGHVKNVIFQRFSNVTDAFRHFKSREEGLTGEDLKRLFLECGRRLDAAELDRVMASVDKDNDQIISMTEFCENLLCQQFLSDFSQTKDNGLPNVSGPLRSQQDLEAYKNREKEAHEALRNLISCVEARRTLLIRAFQQEANASYDGNLAVEDFKRALTERMGLTFTDKQMDSLIFKFYSVPGTTDWSRRRLPLKEIKRLIMF